MRIAATVRDGHSGVDVSFREGKTHVPLWLGRFPDGLFVRAAAKEYPQAVGARVVAIGGVPVDKVLRLVDALVYCDPGNDGQRWSWQPLLYLTDPLILHGLRVSDSNKMTTYTLQKNGVPLDLELQPAINAGDLMQLSGPQGWLAAQPVRSVQPLNNAWTKPLQFGYVPDAKAIYLQFNEVQPPDGESMQKFVADFEAFVGSQQASRLIIDLRHNSGGDNTILTPLLISLIRSPFNHRGGMFVLIGPTTFSAAQNFVNRLESYANPILVGEPTSNNVNFYGDPVGVELPNSHLDVEMARLWWQDKDPRDTRSATFPEIAVPQETFDAFVAGKDAALDYCLHSAAPATFEDLMQAAASSGENQALARYRVYADDPTHRYAVTLEKQLNTLAYSLLQTKQITAALALFRVNAEEHPDSANAFDSLGEGEEAQGDKAAAIQAYQRSLALNPDNRHAQQALTGLK